MKSILVDKQEKLKILENELIKLKKGKVNNDPKLPKSIEQC